MTRRGIHHPYRQLDSLAVGHTLTRSFFFFARNREVLQSLLCGSKAPHLEAQGNRRQKYDHAKKHSSSHGVQSSKSPEQFPHRMAQLRASRFPPAGSTDRSDLRATIQGRRRIHQEAAEKQARFLMPRLQAATSACRFRPNQNSARFRYSAAPILCRENAPARARARLRDRLATPSAQPLRQSSRTLVISYQDTHWEPRWLRFYKRSNRLAIGGFRGAVSGSVKSRQPKKKAGSRIRKPAERSIPSGLLSLRLRVDSRSNLLQRFQPLLCLLTVRPVGIQL